MYDYSVFNGNTALTGNSIFESGPNAGIGSAWVRGVTFNGNLTGSYTLTAWLGNGAAGTTGTGTSGLIFNTNSAQMVSATISGSSGLTKSGTGVTTLTAANTYTGATTVNGGTLQLNAGIGGDFTYVGGNVGINNGATFQVNGARYNFAGVTYTFDANGGDTVDYAGGAQLGGFVFTGNNTFATSGGAQDKLTATGGYGYNLNASTALFNITRGTDPGSDLTVSANLWNAGGVTKNGSGILTLSASNTYTGATAVNAGTLNVAGSIASSTVTVNGGGTLCGTGSTGAVTVNSGGTLVPGVSGTGSLSLNNNALSLSGSVVAEISASSGAATAVQNVSSITYGGILTVTNLGGTFASGNTFALFNAASYSGSFSTISLPSLPTGLAWNTNDLPVNGSISVTGTLPSGWTGQDIGAVGVPGSSSYASGTYTVRGSGADIQNSADAFQYVSQSLSGDGEIRAQVTSQGNTNIWAKAGVMIRSGSGAGAINALVALTPGNGFTFQYRTAANGTTAYTTGSSNAAPNNWVRLSKSGTLITAYISSSGTSWTSMGTVNLTTTNAVTMGLAVTSHSNSAISAATFANVSITPFPSPWVSADLGSPGALGSAEYFNGIYTLHGAGNVSSTADNFHFVYQTLSGTGSMVTQITAPQNTGTNARLGVMIRNALTNNAAYAFIGVSGTSGYVWQTRTSSGGSPTTTLSGHGTAPNLWVKVLLSGTTFTGYTSTSGTSWTQIGSKGISMGSSTYIGFVDASGSSSSLNTTTFANPSVQ